MAKKVIDRQWEEIPDGGNYVKFEKVGQTVEGYYLGRQESTKQGFSATLSFQQEDGTPFSLSETAVLATKLATAKKGDYVQVVYDGKHVSKNGRTVNGFTVRIARAQEAG